MNTTTAWSLLLLASVFEIGFAVSMKFTGGFTRLGPSALTVVLAAASMLLLSLLSRALGALPIGTAYAAWTGVGAVGTALIGIVVLREPATVARLISLALVVIGLVGLRFFSPESSRPTADTPAQAHAPSPSPASVGAGEHVA